MGLISPSDLGWSPLPEGASSLYRRAVIGPAPPEGVPGGVDHLVWNAGGVSFWPDLASRPQIYSEVGIYHVIDRLKPDALVRFWRDLYAACKPGCIVRVHGAYWSHFDVSADPTRYRGLSERMFGYLSALGREQLRRDPFEDDHGLSVYNGVDFEAKAMTHIVEPEWEGRSDDARAWATQHHINVVRRLVVVLEAHKPCRRGEGA